MSNELERAYAALDRDASERALLLPAADLRARARRRTAVRTAATLVAVAVLAAGTTIGVRVALAGPDRPDPILPATSPTPSVSPSPVSSPSPSSSPSSPPPPSSAPPSSAPPSSAPPSSPAAPAIPKSIPARAMLNKADGNMDTFNRLDEPRAAPSFCSGADFPSEDQAGVRASGWLLFRSPELGPEYTAEDQIYNTVTVYRGDGASAFMDELAAAVEACPEGEVGDLPARFRDLGPLELGDESLMIERSTAAYNDDGSPAEGRRKTFVAAVRVGDAVTMLESSGYESGPSDPDDVEALAATATVRLAGWRQ
ncbi:hypothetical protein ACTI_79880 [Actinoplanes sp. OR16]|uniref:hypothetical protein n=1 Tax=Actinoplanes sp. OR16 TaxID=946334 RepID=UPI000F6B59A4|nr:hypothetical protein [Actinoplanes sp. OR16]BBH71303.1 hypothetical protein ACTI_79880 [Actinoplanes sp. OR16]